MDVTITLGEVLSTIISAIAIIVASVVALWIAKSQIKLNNKLLECNLLRAEITHKLGE